MDEERIIEDLPEMLKTGLRAIKEKFGDVESNPENEDKIMEAAALLYAYYDFISQSKLAKSNAEELARSLKINDFMQIQDIIAEQMKENPEKLKDIAEKAAKDIEEQTGIQINNNGEYEKALRSDLNRSNKRLNKAIQEIRENINRIISLFIEKESGNKPTPETLQAFISVLDNAAIEADTTIYDITTAYALQEEPGATKAEKILKAAYSQISEFKANPIQAPKYEINMFDSIPLFHSNIVNKLFGIFHEPLPIDGKTRNLASETEYYSIEKVNGKKLKKPLVIEASMENINELLEITGQTQFDFFVWCLGNKCWNTGNRFFTTEDIYKLSKCDKKAKASKYMLKRYEESIEKLSAIRLNIKTYDRNGNLKKEKWNMLTTVGQERTAPNHKTVAGYIMLVPPALNSFSLEMNPFYNIPIDLINYPTSGKQDRAVCISTFLIQRIELKKAELKKAQKAAYDKALRAAKEAEKQAALNEHRKANNDMLEIEKYYPKIYYKKYRAVIDVQELCEKSEEKKTISKDVKSKIISETEKCLKHFMDKNYIKGFNIPAGKHNKTENIIIEIFETEQALETENRLEKNE